MPKSPWKGINTLSRGKNIEISVKNHISEALTVEEQNPLGLADQQPRSNRQIASTDLIDIGRQWQSVLDTTDQRSPMIGSAGRIGRGKSA